MDFFTLLFVSAVCGVLLALFGPRSQAPEPVPERRCSTCKNEGILTYETGNQQIAGCEMDVLNPVCYTRENPCPECGAFR